MKQQFLELIDRKIEAYNNGDSLSGYEKLLQELLQEVEKIEEWIPVTERLPETKGSYNVFVEGIVTTLYYSELGWYTEEGTRYSPTHWIPLPNPPTI